MPSKIEQTLRSSIFLGQPFKYIHLWILTVLLAQHSYSVSRFLTKPMNTVTVVGNKTRLECSRNLLHLPVKWTFNPARTGDGTMTRNISRYNVDTDGQARYDIVINSANFSDAGMYTCSVDQMSASAQLIVLASDPVCGTDVKTSKGETVEGDYSKFSCKVTYNGNWEPRIDYNVSKAIGGGGGLSTSGSSVRIFTGITTQLTSSDNGVTITWKTSFPRPSTMGIPGLDAATNDPHYQHIWNVRINVSYGVRNPTIEPNRTIYAVGDRLFCSADGNPGPRYQWSETETGRIINGSIQTIDETMLLQHNLTFKCTATNIVERENKEISKVITFRVTVSETSNSWIVTIIAIVSVVGGTVFTVLIVLGLVKALKVKGSTKVTRRSSRVVSIQDQDYEMVDVSKIQSGYYETLHQNQGTSDYDDTSDHAADNLPHEGYSLSAVPKLPPVRAQPPTLYLELN